MRPLPTQRSFFPQVDTSHYQTPKPHQDPMTKFDTAHREHFTAAIASIAAVIHDDTLADYEKDGKILNILAELFRQLAPIFLPLLLAWLTPNPPVTV